MKKLLVLLTLLSAMVLAACNTGSKTEHTHSFTTYTSDNNATCTVDGTETAKCDGCDETHTRVVPNSKLAHSFTNYVSDNNATCTTDCTETAKCDNCNETNTRIIVDSKAEHSFTNYVSDNNATVEADGTETAKCDHCDATDTRTDEDSNQVVTDYMLSETLKYTGLLVNGKAQGEGTLVFTDSNCVYVGDFVDGLYHGEGVFTWPSGWKYEGSFAEGKATYGTTTKPEGSYGLISYTGAMHDLLNIDSTQVGTGYVLFDNGCNYTGGLYSNGALEGWSYHGEGVFKWTLDDSGWKFVGSFANGKATYGKTTTNKTNGLLWYEGAMNDLNDIKVDELGTGYYLYPDGCNYTGTMYAHGALEGCTFEGEGTFKWPNGQTFVGTYSNGSTIQGKLTYPNTMTYEGGFTGSYVFHGEGVFNWTTYNADGTVANWGQRYEGQLANGTAAGLRGKLTFAIGLNGSNAAGLHYFEGEMASLETLKTNQTGTGKIVFEDGSYYIGEVYLDVNHVASAVGNGTYYYPDDSTVERKEVSDYMLDDVRKYSGVIVNNLPQGEGTLVFTDSNCVYVGDFVDGLYHGEGVFTWPSGWKYEGSFAEGKATYGTTTKPEGSYGLISYTGAMHDLLNIDSTQVGTGYVLFDNGCNYTGGLYSNGALEGWSYHGEGVFKWTLDDSGWKFVGTFANGKATYGKTTTNRKNAEGLIWYEGAMNDLNDIKADELGYGYYDYNNGCNYTGQMYSKGALDGATFHGEGTFKWTYDDSGWKFVGTFTNGAATYGKTTTNKTSGLIWYEGAMNGLNNIKNDELGTGCYDYGDGCSYTGTMYAHGALEGCTFHGEGTFRWPNGQTYVGNYENGKTTTGKLTYPNTMTYEGQFNGDYVFHGEGVFNWTTYNEDGSVKEWGQRYEGQVANGTAAGLRGKLTFAIGLNSSNAAGLHYFEGEMASLETLKADQTGTGKIVFEDGTYYIGDVYLAADYKASVVGSGTYYNADGSVKE